MGSGVDHSLTFRARRVIHWREAAYKFDSHGIFHSAFRADPLFRVYERRS